MSARKPPAQITVVADLTIESPEGTISVSSEPNGPVIVNCPSGKSLLAAMDIHWPTDNQWNVIRTLNKTLLNLDQVLDIRVNGKTWIRMGTNNKPYLSYSNILPAFLGLVFKDRRALPTLWSFVMQSSAGA